MLLDEHVLRHEVIIVFVRCYNAFLYMKYRFFSLIPKLDKKKSKKEKDFVAGKSILTSNFSF